MEDQVTGVPHFLRAHCLHTNQTPGQRLKIQQMIANGEIDILLVSPEAVVSGERATGFGAILRQLPPIAFACIDEAHCVSQWSHNFRPSYLMICKVLKKNLGVQTVLGLTATATLPTRISIINHLGITDGERGIISDIPLPDNLILSVSKDENRDAALLQLLNSDRYVTKVSLNMLTKVSYRGAGSATFQTDQSLKSKCHYRLSILISLPSVIEIVPSINNLCCNSVSFTQYFQIRVLPVDNHLLHATR